jgi:MFS family permease
VPVEEWGRRSVPPLLTTAFCSSAAAVGLTTIVGKQVYDITGRAFDLGLLGLAEFAPAALLVLVTGGVADRFDRRKVAAAGALGMGAAAAALAWYAATDPTSAAPIFLIVLVFGVSRAFYSPAERSLPADIVIEERVPWLVARHAGLGYAGGVFGPVLCGSLYAVDVSLPYVAVLILAVIAAVAVLRVTLSFQHHVEPFGSAVAADAAELRPAGAEPETSGAPVEAGTRASRASWSEAIEGLRFIRSRPILVGALSLDLFAVLFGGAVALLPAIATDRLGVGAVGLGWLRAAAGIGSASVMLKLALRPITRRVGKTMLVAVAGFGVGTIVLGLTRSYAVAFVAMVALSGADAISVFVRSTLVPLITPPDRRGRVLAVENLFIGGSNELGAFESGVAAQLIGTTGAVVLGGIVTVVVAMVWWVAFPPLRNVDRFPGWSTDPDP